MKKTLQRPLVLAAIFFLAPVVIRAATFSLEPMADAFVTTGATGDLSADNFGGAGALAIAAPGLPQGEFQSVLQFDLLGARDAFDAQFGAGQWTVQSVTLHLTSSPHSNVIFNNIAAGLFGVSLMQNNSWVEGTGTGGTPTTDGISFDSLQGVYINNAADEALGTFSFPGGSSGANNYGLTLAPGLVSDLLSGGDASLRLFAADSVVSYLLDSRTGGSSSSVHPGLTIDAEPIPEPGTCALIASAAAISGLNRRLRRLWTGRPGWPM